MNNDLYSLKYRIISHVISFIIYPFFVVFNLFRYSYKINDIDVKVILVNEYHRIGDVIIISPILKSLKKKYPKAELILITSKQAENLAIHHNLADTIIGINAPWTNWDWSLKKWWSKIIFFSKVIRGKNIDLAFSFKGDIRDSFFLWLTKPKISFGYSFTGGKYFYTDPQLLIKSYHQQERAYKLIEKIGCIIIPSSNINYNIDGGIVIHPGSSDSRRAWPDKHWIDLIQMLNKKEKIYVVKVKDSIPILKKLDSQKIIVKTFSGSLVDYSNWVKNQKLVIGLDSMAGHLAAFHNIPSITIFGSQNPKLSIPVSKKSILVKPELNCYHKRNHWRLCKKCMSLISSQKVFNETVNLLNEIKNQT